MDQFLEGLMDASYPSSLANILELEQYPSKENADKFRLLEYELEKHALVELVNGRDNSTINGQCEYIISGKGLDFVMSGKSTLELFENDEIDLKMENPKIQLDNLTQRAEEYLILTMAEPLKSKVNKRENINSFLNWYYESRNIFRDYIDENDHDFKEFTSFDLSGNGTSLASNFSRMYPLFNVLKGKILNGQFSKEQEKLRKMNNKGFVIHGHNEKYKFEVARIIEKKLNKEAIILHEQANKGKTVIEKFESNSEVDFAVALWTADDQGKSSKDKEFQLRARQNVIFETGYFIGKLGRDRVIVLYEDGVEKPSDYDGVIYISLSGNWWYNLILEIESIYK
ncbi:Predicted nucleotide-binding protein containing TIR-like domain-containing protein [Aquiflexum balticum DSM 16537]|uniref:Predicted nucleotide-binding protein containing TIR-like domain-containing protein n=2 Tax=Aquiflexum TaxID=280472 RepID=A0A1W2H824_9BACT|nr:Predicted nucleotide-binding protein containing TIR-like domain-containing protein [Aquiflexum balticum DSM 16537]